MSEPGYHFLKISVVDEKDLSGIGCVQGAGFEPEEARRQFDLIPERPDSDFEDGEHTVVLDYLNENREIESTKFIHPDIAVELTGLTKDEIFERAWADIARAQQQLQDIQYSPTEHEPNH